MASFHLHSKGFNRSKYLVKLWLVLRNNTAFLSPNIWCNYGVSINTLRLLEVRISGAEVVRLMKYGKAFRRSSTSGNYGKFRLTQ